MVVVRAPTAAEHRLTVTEQIESHTESRRNEDRACIAAGHRDRAIYRVPAHSGQRGLADSDVRSVVGGSPNSEACLAAGVSP